MASFSVGLRLLLYFLFSRFPLDVLWAPFTILWVFACFLMDPLPSSVRFPCPLHYSMGLSLFSNGSPFVLLLGFLLYF